MTDILLNSFKNDNDIAAEITDNTMNHVDSTNELLSYYQNYYQYYNDNSEVQMQQEWQQQVGGGVNSCCYMNQQQQQEQQIEVNTNIQIIDDLTAISSSNSPSTTTTSSTNDYLSSDEGYVGSFNELNILTLNRNKNKHQKKKLRLKLLEATFNNNAQQSQEQVEEELHTQYDVEEETDEDDVEDADDDEILGVLDDDSQQYLNNFNLSLNEVPFYVYDQNELDDANTSGNESIKLYDLYYENFCDYKRDVVLVEEEEGVLNQAKLLNNDEFYDDFIDITAYLYEIDMNLDYYQLLDFKQMDDDQCDEFLRFNNKNEACNLRHFAMHIDEYNHYLRIEQENYEALQQQQVDVYGNGGVDVYGTAQQDGTYVDYMSDYLTNYDATTANVMDDLDATLCVGGGGLPGNQDYYGSGGDIFDNVYNVYLQDDASSTADTNDMADTNSVKGSCSGRGLLIPRYSKSIARELQQFRKPCMYMLNDGQCLRADCRFAHDLHNITCKYWLDGECLKGDACEFLHDFPAKLSASQVNTESSTPTGNGSLSSSCTSSTTFSYQYSSKLKTKRAQQEQQQAEIQKQKMKDFNLDTLDFPELSTVPSTTTTANTNTNDIENEITSPIVNTQNESESIKIQQKPTAPASTTTTTNKKSRKFKDNILVSLSLPALTNSSRKKHIN